MDQINQLIMTWVQNEDSIYRIIDAILFLLFLIAVLYLLIFAIFSLKKRKNTYPPARKRYRFAVLFPCYMEDEVILNSVNSFFDQEYPRELYDVIVISDRMTEETDQALRDLSALVVKADSPQSTKTNALRRAIRYIEEEKRSYDIVVILDADNLVDLDFLDKINDAFYSGCMVVQTHRVAKNRNTSIAVLDAVSEEINNSIFRKGHTELGFSSALIGSGMAFDYQLFKEYIQTASSIGIDKNLEKSLLKNYIFIEYLETVFTYDEKVKQKADFYNQRRRWLATQFYNLFSGFGHILIAILKGNWDYVDKLFQWMMPPRIMLFGLITLIAIGMTWINWTLSVKWWGLLLLLCIAFSIAVPNYLVDKKFKKAILSIPLLFILMLFNHFRMKGATKEFIHTKHSSK
nr:glycosyltransferase family 2 protein [Parabacteroides goldsteinii]